MQLQSVSHQPANHPHSPEQQHAFDAARFAMHMAQRYRGDMNQVLRAIFTDPDNPRVMRSDEHIVRRELKSVIDHLALFTAFLWAGGSQGSTAMERGMAPLVLAQIATLPVAEHAERALDQLEMLVRSAVAQSAAPSSAGHRLDDRFGRALVCLARHLAEMPPHLAQRAGRLIEDCADKLADPDKRYLYATCAGLPRDAGGSFPALKALGERGEQEMRQRAAQTADQRGRAMLAGQDSVIQGAMKFVDKELRASAGDVRGALHAIVQRAQNLRAQGKPDALADELAAMVCCSGKVRTYLGIGEPSDAGGSAATASRLTLLNDGIIPWTLAQVVVLSANTSGAGRTWPTLRVERPVAERALQQLENLLEELGPRGIDAGYGTWIVDGFRSLVARLHDMPEFAAEYAVGLIESGALLLQPEQRHAVLEACRRLPHSSSSAVMMARECGIRNFLETLEERRGQEGAATMRGPILGHIRPENQPEDDRDFSGFNPYWMRIIHEARSRGIDARVRDNTGVFELRHAGRTILCAGTLPETIPELTCQLCADKVLTSRYLDLAGIPVPEQQIAGDRERDLAFLKEHGSVVVKPGTGQKGQNVIVDVRGEDELVDAIERAATQGKHVVLEKFYPGDGLRILVVNYEVVAAGVRRAPVLIGDGKITIGGLIERYNDLVERHNRPDEGKIPRNAETEWYLALQGLDYDAVPGVEQQIQVRRNANISTGGKNHDVTAELHPALRQAAENIAHLLEHPMVGLDFIVQSPSLPDYVTIEANSSPGLGVPDTNPFIERYIDFLVPETATRA